MSIRDSQKMTSMPLAIQFGIRVRELRQAMGMSQEAFAFHAGIARSYMSRLELGKAEPRFEMLETLARALGVKPSQLLEPPAALDAPAKPKKRAKTVVLVPFDKTGHCFNPTLRQKMTGEFAVGGKSARKKFKSFAEALVYLRTMKPAQWPRPNERGGEGVVTAVEWKPLPEEFLEP
jgi:transcriptional regulator with XRE-family HTH domain